MGDLAAQVILEFNGSEDELDEFIEEMMERDNWLLQDCQTYR